MLALIKISCNVVGTAWFRVLSSTLFELVWTAMTLDCVLKVDSVKIHARDWSSRPERYTIQYSVFWGLQ